VSRSPRRRAPQGRAPTPSVPHRRLGPRAWFTHHARAALSSLGYLWRARGASLATIAVLAVAIAFPSSLALFVRDGAQLAARFRGEARIDVYLRTDLDGARARSLAHEILAGGTARTVRVLSRRASLAEFARWSGLGPHARDFFGPHPLPAVVVVTPRATRPRAVRRLARTYARLPDVAEVHTDARWLAHLRLFLTLGRRVVWTLAVLFALAALLVVGNTIRLDVENAREEIQVLKMVGATDAFVRRPFLYRGTYYGLAGGLGACLLVVLINLLVAPPLGRLGMLYDSGFRIDGPGLRFVLVLLLSGGALGWLGAARAVRGELRRLEALL
jgi:cell division transport system permease protein